MQQFRQDDARALIEQVVVQVVPNSRGLDAWQALLRAHATLMRQLATDLVEEVGLTLGDFDVLAQLAQAGGELRMSELAAQTYSSRSGMTRRIDRIVGRVWTVEPTPTRTDAACWSPDRSRPRPTGRGSAGSSAPSFGIVHQKTE